MSDGKKNEQNDSEKRENGSVSADLGAQNQQKRPSQSGGNQGISAPNAPIHAPTPSASGAQNSLAASSNINVNDKLKQQVLKELSALKGQIQRSDHQNNTEPTVSKEILAMREEMSQMRSLLSQNTAQNKAAQQIAATRSQDMNHSSLDDIEQQPLAQESHIQSNGLNAELARIRAHMSNMAREDSVRRLSSTYANLAERLDQSVASGDVLRRLSTHMSQTQTALESLPSTRHFANFEEQISNSNGAIERVEARLAQINDLMKSTAAATAQPANNAHSDEISHSLNEISSQINNLSSNEVKTPKVDFTKLESKLDEMGQQIAGLKNTGKSNEVAPDATARLESQITNIASLLNNTNSKFDQLDSKFEEQRDRIFDAAKLAAEQAVASMPKGEGDPNMLANLAQDIEALRSNTTLTSEETKSAFMGIQSSLELIVDRLERLEDGQNALSPQAKESEVQPFAANAVSGANTGAVSGKNPLLAALEQKAAQEALNNTQSNVALAEADSAMAASTSSAKPQNMFEAAALHQHTQSQNSQSIDEDNSQLDEVNAPAMQPSFADQDDSILEPGETPDPSNIGSENKANELSNSPEEGMDFIAAARRASQSNNPIAGNALGSLEDDATLEPKTALDEEEKPSRLRKPLLIASAAVVLAFAAIRITPIVTGENGNPLTSWMSTQNEQFIQQSSTDKSTAAGTGEASLDETANAANTSQAADKPAGENTAQANSAELSATQASLGEDIGEVPALNAAIGTPALRDAVKNGDPAAMFEVGLLYTEGTEITRNEAEAAKWYRLAAERDLAPAQFRLGSLLEKGKGVSQDHDEAAKWYQKAATAGNARAMHNLGVLHTEEVAGGIKVVEATQMFRKAAQLGVRDSQFNLGMMYSRGLGVALDLQESYKWFSLAAQGGDTEAAKNRDQVANVMLPEDLEKAKVLVSSWRPADLKEAANTVKIPPEWTKAPQASSQQADSTDQDQSAEAASTPASTQSDASLSEITLNIQSALLRLGYDVGSPDGVMGPKTETAIRSFQDRIGLPATGRPSAQLLEILKQSNT